MKRIFSFLVALILVSSSFGVTFAQDTDFSTFSIQELEQLMKEKEQELEWIYQQYSFSTRKSNGIDYIKEKEAMKIKNTMADIKIELLKRSGELYQKDVISDQISSRIYAPRPFTYKRPLISI